MLQPSTIKFLKDLTRNNNKPWFDAHRAQYDDARNDYEQFIATIIERYGRRDPDVKELEARTCLFRINRDIRFSKDKTPYKTNLGAFLARGGRKSHYAGYYLHIEPGNKTMMGGGIWMPQPEHMKKIRQEIDYNWKEFQKIITSKKFKSVFGDLERGAEMSLSKVPQGYEKDNPAADNLKLKSWVAMRYLKDEELTSPTLIKETLDTLATLYPLIQFLNEAVD